MSLLLLPYAKKHHSSPSYHVADWVSPVPEKWFVVALTASLVARLFAPGRDCPGAGLSLVLDGQQFGAGGGKSFCAASWSPW